VASGFSINLDEGTTEMKLLERKRKQLDYQDLLQQDVGYATATAKLYDLQRQRDEIKTTLETQAKSSVQREAEALLSGQPEATASRDELQHRLATFTQAIEIQGRTVRQAESQAIAKMRDANQPEHAELLRDLRDKILAAEVAAIALERFYHRTDNAVHRVMRFSGLGDFVHHTGRFDAVQRWQVDGEEFRVFEDVSE